MTNTEFTTLFESMKKGITDLAKSTVSDYASQAASEGQGAISSMKNEIREWTEQVLNGEMTPDDMKFLLEGRKELLHMAALRQKGMAIIQIEKFRQGVINIIIGSVSKAFK